MTFMTIAVILYFGAVAYLGYRGFRQTHTATDYMLGGRKIHPFVMAMSYGATFISTSAIVGFGGAAGVFGMGLLWLTFLNIFVGIFIAFVFFGGRTRRIGLRLDAHTFPELLGRRFQSRFIQMAVGSLIFLFMPLYASAVLMGAAKYLAQQLNMPYEAALFTFSVIIALYVVMGGMKGVMYTDAFQGSLMFVGMAALLVLTYVRMGGITEAHAQLTALAPMVPAKLAAGGHLGWTAMPVFGSPLWWTLVSTIVLGVGIGVLAQPQLVVRYMTVKSRRELDRAVAIGGVFILMMTGVAFVVGALSNVYFQETTGKVAIAAAGGDVERIIPLFLQGAMPGWFGILFMLTLLSAAMSTLSSQFHTMGTSLGRDVYEQLPRKGRRFSGVMATQTAVLVGIMISVYLGYELERRFGKTGQAIVAHGTALFFGLCASAFLPMYVGSLWSRRITRTGAIAGMVAGALASLLWMLFVQEKASGAFLLCERLFGVRSLGLTMVDGAAVYHRTGRIVWAFVDPMVAALPVSIIVTWVVSLFTPRLPEAHLERCFGPASANAKNQEKKEQTA
jgi:SSS family solute:Na+ symporter